MEGKGPREGLGQGSGPTSRAAEELLLLPSLLGRPTGQQAGTWAWAPISASSLLSV